MINAQTPTNKIEQSSTAHNSTSVATNEIHALAPENGVLEASSCVYNAERIDTKSFPDQPRLGTQSIPCTIPNIKHVLLSYGITARYDVIGKKTKIVVPGHIGTHENVSNTASTYINSLAALNGLASGQIPSYVEVIGDENLLNPVADWILSKTWDGRDRLPELYGTLVESEGYPRHLKETLMKRWLLSAVAAALKPNDFHCRGVLTLQGPQSIGKTSWIKSLVPNPVLSEQLVKLDHHLDASQKDSILTAVSHWIVEIGELDSSFKKDIARLKGFLTAGSDKLRRPYARYDSEYQRRTVFCASVNAQGFLIDDTGNSRWWTIAVTSINHQHNIDMQQVFAQLADEFYAGQPWWLTQEEEEQLEWLNARFRVVSALREKLLDAIDMDRSGSPEKCPAMTASEVLMGIGISYPTNPQSRECGAILRELFGESKRICGRDKWRVKLKDIQYGRALNSEPAEVY
jgi:predicted P-loop ATPase